MTMLNFYVVSAGGDIVNDTDRSTTPRSKFTAPTLKRKIQKRRSFRKHGFHLITVWLFQTKNSKLSRLALGNKKRNHIASKATTEDRPCNQEEINRIFFERGLQVKFVKTSARLQLVMSQNDHFFGNLLGHGKFNETLNAATFRPRLRSTAVLPSFRRNML